LTPGENANPDTDHQVEPGVGQRLQVLVAVGPGGVRLVRDDVLLTHEAVGDRLLETGVRCVVERLVAEATDVERDPDLHVRVAFRAGTVPPSRCRQVPAGLTAVVIAAARRSDDGQYADEDQHLRSP
jgi:hypothetical protein